MAYKAKVGYPPMAGKSWTCDGGAVMLSHLAERMNLDHKLCVGLYQHQDADSLGRATGQSPEEILDGIKEKGELVLDEWHCWAEVQDPETEQWWTIDPNGEARDEPRMQLAGEAEWYRADDAQGIWGGIDSRTDPLEVMKGKNWKAVLRLAEQLAEKKGIDLVSVAALKARRRETALEVE